MNTLWLSNIEILHELRQADFRREMEILCLEREAQMTKPRKPNWIQRYVHNMSHWMIAAGERLNRRIHDPIPVPRWYQSFKVAR